MHQRDSHADAAKEAGHGQPSNADFVRHAPLIAVRPIGARRRMSSGWRRLQQKQQWQQDQKIAHTDVERRITPADFGDQKTSDVGHDALPDGSAGSYDANREPLALFKPKPRNGDHRGKLGGKAKGADQKVNDIERPQITLPAQCDQPERNSKGSKVSDLTGADTIGKTAPNDAADRAADGQECKGHRDIGTIPSEFLLERLHENRDGAIRAEPQCQADRRHADNDPAIGSLGELLISTGVQVSISRLDWFGWEQIAPIAGAIPVGLLDLPLRTP